jgi:hypothetical protein
VANVTSFRCLFTDYFDRFQGWHDPTSVAENFVKRRIAFQGKSSKWEQLERNYQSEQKQDESTNNLYSGEAATNPVETSSTNAFRLCWAGTDR